MYHPGHQRNALSQFMHLGHIILIVLCFIGTRGAELTWFILLLFFLDTVIKVFVFCIIRLVLVILFSKCRYVYILQSGFWAPDNGGSVTFVRVCVTQFNFNQYSKTFIVALENISQTWKHFCISSHSLVSFFHVSIKQR